MYTCTRLNPVGVIGYKIQVTIGEIMKRISFLIFLIALSGVTYGQVDSTKLNKWVPGGIVGLNISQVALDNWTAGGESSHAFGFISKFFLAYQADNWLFDNKLKLAYGRSKIGDDDFRNTDNEIFMDNVFSYNVGWSVDPYVSNTLRSVIADGFDYTGDTPVKISSFWDPGYLNQGIGMTYQQNEFVSTRLGIGFKETFTSEFTQYSDDPETGEVETFKFETGIEFVTKAKYIFSETVGIESELFLFSAFNELDVWDVRWDTTFMAKISEWFNFNINVLLVYDKTQSVKTQLKEALQFGITYNLF